MIVYHYSIVWMADDTLKALESGVTKVRLHFDTSVGDETYTMLKQSLPMTQRLVQLLAPRLKDEGVLRLFFPDMGTAAMMMKEWRFGTNESTVPHNLAFASMHMDKPEPGDAGCLVSNAYIPIDAYSFYHNLVEMQGQA
jgi:hypothetical protein